MSGRAFYSFSLSFMAGIFTASFAMFAMSAISLACTMCLGIFAYLACAGWERFKKSNLLFLAGCALAFWAGYCRFFLSENGHHPLDDVLGHTVVLEGVICGEPEMKEITQRFCFQPDGTDDRIIVSSSRYPEYEYGDRLAVSGVLELPENFETYEGGPVFDYISYLQKDDIRFRMSKPAAEIIGKREGNEVVRMLIGIKSAFMERVERSVPEPQASLVAGILLGEKGALPQDVSDAFRRSGLTHILVLSGSNVTVVAETLMKLFSFMPRVLGLWFGAGSIVLFAVMTGASATTIRATAMALVVILSKGSGRRYDVTRALVFAALVMLLENPRILMFDIGFQLSFLATLALLYVSPIVSGLISFIPERFQIREIISTSLSTQLFTLPFILYSMGEISIISLIPNLLVLPLVPWAMFGGFITGICGFMALFVAFIPAAATTALLSWMVFVVSFFAPMPFATAKAVIGHWTLFASYFLYIVFLMRAHKGRAILESS